MGNFIKVYENERWVDWVCFVIVKVCIFVDG